MRKKIGGYFMFILEWTNNQLLKMEWLSALSDASAKGFKRRHEYKGHPICTF